MTTMAKAVKLSDELVAEAKKHAKANCRSVPGQIEFWAKVGRNMEANPDLPYQFVVDILLALEDDSEPTEYKFGPL